FAKSSVAFLRPAANPDIHRGGQTRPFRPTPARTSLNPKPRRVGLATAGQLTPADDYWLCALVGSHISRCGVHAHRLTPGQSTVAVVLMDRRWAPESCNQRRDVDVS